VALFGSTRPPKKRTVARHEHLVFYPSFAARTPDGTGWTLHVQGSVFDPRVSWLRRKPVIAVVRRILRMDRTAEEYFRVRMRQFLMFGLRGRFVSVRIGDHARLVGDSDYMGLFRGEITLSDSELSQVLPGGTDGTGWLSYRAVLNEADDRAITGTLQLIEPAGMSIISDVDDTIKHSNVPNRGDLFRNTFTRTFVPIAGMPELYRDCAQAGAAFHFVSGSPWQLYEPLSEFLRAEGYPAGSFHLKRFRIRDSARKIRKSPQKAYKRGAIEPILAAFPQRKFVLIGDSGEQDPEIYASFLRERPQQIAGVFIRAVRGEMGTGGRLQAAFMGLDPARWVVYREPDEIREQVAGLVRGAT
jgi:phosphatidate phosphatase APP1